MPEAPPPAPLAAPDPFAVPDPFAAPELHAAEPIPAAALADLARLLATGDLFRYATDPSPVAAFEAEFAAALGARFALAVSSCSAALFLALRALGLPPGARVLLPAFTFAAVPSAVVHAGCVPVLSECGADLRPCLDDAEAKVGDCDALLLSHMRGHMGDVGALLALAGDRPVIEDAAHALGALWAGRPAGRWGRVGCYSFQSNKMLNAGEGGMLVTDDADLFARAVVMSGAYERNWARHPGVGEAAARWQGRLPLYNLRMGNLAAAVLRPQLAELPGRVARGRRNHDRVAAALAASPHVALPRPLPPEARAPDSIQFALPRLPEPAVAAFARACDARGLPLQVLGLAPGNARAYWSWEFLPEPPPLPRTRAMLLRTCDLRLPARLSDAACDRVAALLLDALDEVAAPARAFGT